MIGLLLVGITVFIFRLGSEGLLGLLINVALGAVIVAALNFFGIFPIPLNPLTAIMVGFGGVIGLALIIVVMVVF